MMTIRRSALGAAGSNGMEVPRHHVCSPNHAIANKVPIVALLRTALELERSRHLIVVGDGCGFSCREQMLFCRCGYGRRVQRVHKQIVFKAQRVIRRLRWRVSSAPGGRDRDGEHSDFAVFCCRRMTIERQCARTLTFTLHVMTLALRCQPILAAAGIAVISDQPTGNQNNHLKPLSSGCERTQFLQKRF
ncbi:hypothetical protein [Rhizobium sp. PEPV16]|uniref:hypothetical protein n=1 Tax=Rhizobium sp. PEPV16 TaxID=1820614 RepID=UPI00124C1F9B|nr:hypothetical protein [Rhizobium sp. PEPV16]KAF5881297.1 hypothetical protein FY112_30360 [Rhizobium sp. PEPV16]